MQLETLKLLEDVRWAAAEILLATRQRCLADFLADLHLRLVVERLFEIVGEALNRLFRSDRAIAEQVSEARLIVDFRNRLAHGYNEIDYEVVWQIVQTKVPVLLSDVHKLLASRDQDEAAAGQEQS